MPYNYTLILNKPDEIIQLPQKWNDVSKLRVRAFRYTTQQQNQKFMTINISGWNENNYLFNTETNKHVQYTKFLLLPDSQFTTSRFTNVSDYFDVIKKDKTSFANIEITCKIDGEVANDITSLNPVIIEIYCE